jgi:hypothetical protein
MSHNTVAAPANAPSPNDRVPSRFEVHQPVLADQYPHRLDLLRHEDMPGGRLPHGLGHNALSSSVVPVSPLSAQQGRMLLPVVTERATSRGRHRQTPERHAAPTQHTEAWHHALRSPRRRFENDKSQPPFEVRVTRP